MTATTTPGDSHVLGRRAWWIVAAILLVTLAFRVRLLDAPLERDEGEYAYAGQLILQGVLPYEEVYNMKLPGIYGCYAVVLAVFGETARGIHIGLALVNLATIVLAFLLGRRLAGDLCGVATAAAYALFSSSQTVQGVFANAEHFVVLPGLAGLYVLSIALERGSRRALIGAALLLGMALVVKQHGAGFTLAGGLWVALDAVRRRPFDARRACGALGLYAAVALVPLVLIVFVLALAGLADDLWFWTIDYARTYVTQLPASRAIGSFRYNGNLVTGGAPLAWIVVGFGATTLAWDPATRGHRLPLLALAFASLLAITPGFYFRPHYWVLVLPVAALFYGLGVRAAARIGGRHGFVVAALLVLIPIGASVVRQWDYYVRWSPVDVTRLLYAYNPFAESIEIARIVQQNSASTDRVVVLGSEPQICFYAKRRSATGFIYMYPLMEAHDYAAQLRERMAREVEASDPEVVVVVGVLGSWGGPSGRYKGFEAWMQRFASGYDKVATVPVRLDGLPGEDKVARLPDWQRPQVTVMRKKR